jgi:hypothetical protein
MKPAWDKLMTEFKDHATIVVADVDCTAAGKSLCEAHGVRGYPTIKSGDPANMDDYKGGRDFDALKTHASGLKPSCSPAQIELCDEEGKKKIETVSAMSNEDISKFIAEQDKKLADAESHFSKEVEKLQATYKGLQKAKEDASTEVKASGVGLYKAVLAHKKKEAEIAAGSPDAKKEL